MDILAPAPGPLLRLETPADWAPYGDPATCPVPDGPTRPQTAAGWNTGKTICDLWSYEDSLGVWVLVDGVGWKRLSPASGSGHTHMTLLAGLATHDNLLVDFHEDDYGQIDQLVV